MAKLLFVALLAWAGLSLAVGAGFGGAEKKAAAIWSIPYCGSSARSCCSPTSRPAGCIASHTGPGARTDGALTGRLDRFSPAAMAAAHLSR